MNIFLAVQHTYQGIELALFKDNIIIALCTDDKKRASKNIILLLNQLLIEQGLIFNELDFIAVNQGPGPFTTLRVVIATINGLSFAAGKPIVGIDGLEACLQEYSPQNMPTIALLNAYGNDVYFAHSAFPALKGYSNITSLLAQIKGQYQNQSICFIGNGVTMYQEEIRAALGQHAYFPYPIPEQPTIQKIGLMALQHWHMHNEKCYQVMPLYLKSQVLSEPRRPSDF